MIVRIIVRHVLERLLWKGSKEEMESERMETVVKEEYLKSLGVADVTKDIQDRSAANVDAGDGNALPDDGMGAFWEYDEGLDELSKGVKDA